MERTPKAAPILLSSHASGWMRALTWIFLAAGVALAVRLL
jgi:hypothetical protein